MILCISAAAAGAHLRDLEREELRLKVRLAEAEAQRNYEEREDREWTRTLAHLRIHGDEP